MANALEAIRNLGKVVGYVRVSSVDQNTERQLEGVALDKVFIDKVSGKDTNRPQLKLCLEYLREDDTLMVHSMDRLARNVDDLRRIVRELADKGVTVKFLKENLTFAPKGASIFDQLLLTILGAFAEFERALSKERQREGIAIAKANGVYKGRPRALTPAQIKEMYQLADLGLQKTAIAKKFNISRGHVYDYLKRRKELEVS